MQAVTTFYKFIELAAPRITELKTRLTQAAAELRIMGLMLLGREGCNATIAGEEDAIASFKKILLSIPELAGLEFKDSLCAKNPFRRFKIDLREEIVTSKDESIDAARDSANHLEPEEWERQLSSDAGAVVVDTRNFYETELGMFERAIDLKLSRFSDFPAAFAKLALPKESKVLMYCTGGIRCEKAMVALKNAGYENVHQLKGGILRYLEEFPNSKYKGECFVFDHRVAVDQDLQPSRAYELCPHCGNPAAQELSCMKCGKTRKVCDQCRKVASRNSCSKNCAHHLRLKSDRTAAQGLR